MQAAMFYGPRDVRLIDMATPSPQAGEVLVKVQRAGICGSDVNRFRYGSHPWPPGFIMGHEFCGEIAALGPDVTGLQLGAQIVVEPTLYCGTCPYCRQGYHNRCVDFVRRGLTGSGTNGAFAEYVCVPAYQPHARPEALSIEVAALVEPMAVSVHGWSLAGVQAPKCAVVVGIGNIGLLAILVAKARGAQQIIAIGKYAPRQELAYAYGATLVLEPDDPHLQARVLERTEGLGADVVLEAAGAPSSLRTAVEVACKGGKIVVLGVFHEEVALDYRTILMHEKQIIGSLIYQRQDFADAITILAESGVQKQRHITAEMPLHDIVSHGFLPLSQSRAAHIKMQVYPSA
ncbi:MAG: zinc-binding dehydrogenase [Candidatus Tectomicrobia bacterium]|uniref:Zinc-binding dehydrogenase n=1 Tax=Tectimicrobiota bacterium TaxID=2528274 RepID=A0A938AZ74_UNCTE|nr:zinc-binding dehydrogenase [Candidatus Tectomicrobia bacterium]